MEKIEMKQNAITFHRRAEIALDVLGITQRKRLLKDIESLRDFTPDKLPYPKVKRIDDDPTYILQASDNFLIFFKRDESLEILDVVRRERIEKMFGNHSNAA